MAQREKNVADSCCTWTFEEREPHGFCACVVVSQPFIKTLYQHALDRHRDSVQAYGFVRGETPISYLERTYRSHIIEHLKEFLLNYSVIGHLCEEFYRHDACVVGDPRLVSSKLEPNEGAEFVFSVAKTALTPRSDWRKMIFRRPIRRNYKDIDRQVVDFIREERSTTSVDGVKKRVGISDWVLFGLNLCSPEGCSSLLDQEAFFWIRIGREDADREAQELFLDKGVSDTFSTKSAFLQQFLSKRVDTDYTFLITIVAIVPHVTFSFEGLKQHFFAGGESEKEDVAVHRLLIDVFSMRHDISLRRETIEALFKVLSRQFSSYIPREQIDQHGAYLLKTIQRSPDYPVYRLQKNFKSVVSQLAEKQLRELLIIDHLARAEQVFVSGDDVVNYLGLLTRPRTREFVYFHLPPTQFNGQEQPIPEGVVRQSVLREKVLNTVLNYLAKRA
ncbi:MAG: hypothetical protein JW725_04445 [Candidatus Babeliaceae bacterium]|nr:hypothetical protein [Candidatus Babeliaceae bacterium]